MYNKIKWDVAFCSDDTKMCLCKVGVLYRGLTVMLSLQLPSIQCYLYDETHGILKEGHSDLETGKQEVKVPGINFQPVSNSLPVLFSKHRMQKEPKVLHHAVYTVSVGRLSVSGPQGWLSLPATRLQFLLESRYTKPPLTCLQ